MLTFEEVKFNEMPQICDPVSEETLPEPETDEMTIEMPFDIAVEISMLSDHERHLTS
jgi:hypothetical protein